MALANRASSSATGTNAATVTKPTGTATGDIILAAVFVSGTGLNITVPTGFGLVTSVDNGASARLVWYVKHATSSEPANYTFRCDANLEIVVAVTAYFSTSFGRTVKASSGTTASGTSHAIGALTGPGTSSESIVSVAAVGIVAATSLTPGASHTERQDLAGTTVTLEIADFITTGGSSISGTWTSAAIGVGLWCHVLLMEKGAVQAAGDNGNATVYDGALSLDGAAYQFDELATAFPQDIRRSAGVLPIYESDITVTIGDTGTGSAATKLVLPNGHIRFASGKTLNTRSTQLSSWTLESGEKITSANGLASGRAGADVTLGATAVWRGNLKLYGMHIRQTSGAFSIGSQAGGGLTSEMVTCQLELVAQSTIGSAALGPLSYIYNLDIVSTSTTAVLGFLSADFAELISVFSKTCQRFFNTSLPFFIRDLRLGGTPTLNDIQYLGTSRADVVQITWSQHRAPCLSNGNFWEWWLFRPFVFDPLTGAYRSGVTIDLYRWNTVTLAWDLVVSQVTDSLGQITHGDQATIYRDAVEVGNWSGGVGAETFNSHRFRVVVNGTNPVPGLETLDYETPWPHKTFVADGRTFKQHRNFDDGIPLGSPVVVTPPAPIHVDAVPAPLPSEVRFLVTVPEAA